MNKSIRLTALFCILLTTILLVNQTIIQAFSEEKYAQNPKNMREFLQMQSIARGQIFAGGTVLAESDQNEDETYSRFYPTNSPAFGPVTGYLSQSFGASQVEASYNDVLNGTADSLFSQNWLDVLTGRQPDGANVEVTIDPALQQFAYDQLNDNGYQGAAVAIEPSTGRIKAMSSTPSFDPNGIANPETAEETWAALQEQDGNPLLNHATQETLPPGSIFKIITAAAGLNNGYSPSSDVTGLNSITLPNTQTELTNYDNQLCNGSQRVTLETAFANSCNTAFVEMGIDVGPEQLRHYADAFGVGQNYDLGVGTSPGNLGDIADDAALGQSSIGQRDVTMSALQAAIMGATVANSGTRMEPFMVERLTDSEMNEIRTTKPREAEQAVNSDVATTLTNLMYASEKQTAGYDGNSFASKTGTAEHGEGLAPHVWYVAFDPAKDLAVAVVVKNGGNLGNTATGGKVSAPIGRAILNNYGGGQ